MTGTTTVVGKSSHALLWHHGSFPIETRTRYYNFNMQGKEGSKGNAINPVFRGTLLLGFGGILEVDLS